MITWDLRQFGSLLGIVSATVLLTSCSAEPDASTESLPGFESIDAVYSEVDEVLGCEADRETEPIVDRSADAPLAEYAVCSDLLQIVWFEDEASRVAGQQIYEDGRDPIYMVEGENWFVVDLAEAVGEERSEKDLETLAADLGARYRTLNPTASS